MIYFCDCNKNLPGIGGKIDPNLFKSISEKIFACKKCGAAYIVQEKSCPEEKDSA